MRRRLTARVVAALPAAERLYVCWDTECRRFGVRVGRKGPIAYVVDYTAPDGRRRQMNIARVDAMPPSEARRIARDVLARAARGEDPLAERREARRRATTVGEAWAAYLKEHLDHPAPERRGRRPFSQTTRRSYRWYYERFIAPAFARQRLDAVGREYVERWHSELGARSAFNANRALAVLSAVFAFAERRALIPAGSNPCHGVIRFEEHPRTRFLSEDELRRLAEALREAEESGTESWQAIAAVRLALFTGARRGEVLAMRWSDIDLERRVWRLERSKTGPREIVLNAPALDVLAALPRRAGSPWVLPSPRDPARPFGGLPHAWERIRKRAGIDARFHDLRHSAASAALLAGVPLELIQRLLGHRELRTTQRYAHVGETPLHRAAEAAGQRLREAMEDGGAPGEVIEHPAKGAR